LARASHNRLVSDVTVALRKSLSGLIQESFLSIEDWDAMRGGLIRDHYAIFEAVESGDADTAATRLESHIRDFALTLIAQQSGSAHPPCAQIAPTPSTNER
jgi:DNA-binding FadR family transcriptional regulator